MFISLEKKQNIFFCYIIYSRSIVQLCGPKQLSYARSLISSIATVSSTQSPFICAVYRAYIIIMSVSRTRCYVHLALPFSLHKKTKLQGASVVRRQLITRQPCESLAAQFTSIDRRDLKAPWISCRQNVNGTLEPLKTLCLKRTIVVLLYAKTPTSQLSKLDICFHQKCEKIALSTEIRSTKIQNLEKDNFQPLLILLVFNPFLLPQFLFKYAVFQATFSLP